MAAPRVTASVVRGASINAGLEEAGWCAALRGTPPGGVRLPARLRSRHLLISRARRSAPGDDAQFAASAATRSGRGTPTRSRTPSSCCSCRPAARVVAGVMARAVRPDDAVNVRPRRRGRESCPEPSGAASSQRRSIIGLRVSDASIDASGDASFEATRPRARARRRRAERSRTAATAGRRGGIDRARGRTMRTGLPWLVVPESGGEGRRVVDAGCPRTPSQCQSPPTHAAQSRHDMNLRRRPRGTSCRAAVLTPSSSPRQACQKQRSLLLSRSIRLTPPPPALRVRGPRRRSV